MVILDFIYIYAHKTYQMSKKKFANKQVSAATADLHVTKRELKQTDVNSQMANWFVALLLILPVIFSREVQDPAITPRYVLLSIFAGLFSVFFYVIKKTQTRYPFPSLAKFTFIAGLALTAWSVLSLFSAVNPTAGFYDILKQLLNLLILFFVLTMIAQDETAVLKVCKVFVVVAAIQSLVGIFQFYEIAFQQLPGANAKPYGLMANRNLFGSAQALLVPFVVYVLYKASAKWKYAAIASLVILFYAIVISQTRAAWLATLVSLIVSMVLVMIFSPGNRKKWLIGTAVSFAALLCMGYVAALSDSKEEMGPDVKERVASLINTGSYSSASQANVNDRLLIWKKTTLVVKSHPVTGVGLANWKLNVLSHGGDGTSWASGFYVPDRIHNVYLQIAAETGIVGLLLYLSFWILIAIAGLKVVTMPASEEQRIMVILMLAGLAGFATDSMFSFPTERIEHMLYVMLMVGFILGAYVKNKTQQAQNILPKWLPPLFLVVAFFNLVMGFKKHFFEKNLNYAIACEKQNLFRELLMYTEAGKNSWVNSDQLGISLEAKSSVAYKAQKNFPAALEEMKIAMKLNPNSAMLFNNMGTIYTEMSDFKTAIPYYERALFLAPDFDIVKKNLAMNYYNVANYKGAVALLKSIDLQGDQYLIGVLNEATKLAATQK